MIIISVVMTAENADCQTVYTLQQLRDSAVAGNVKISSSRLDAEAARHRRKEAFTKYFPSVSATGLWFNANKDRAEMEINPSEVIPQELGASLAQSFPPEALAALGNPVTFGMMKDGVIGSVTAVQPVFAGGQIVNGNRLAKIGEEAAELQLPRAYLSLGDKESRTRNQVMAKVGDNIQAQYELLKSSGVDCVLEWNPGNHFRDADIRTARGMAWMLDK